MEIRMNEIVLAGRLVGRPVRLEDGTLHFRLQASAEGSPFHCYCEGENAENLEKFCSAGDEISIEGELSWRKFANEPKEVLLVHMRYASYGRKSRTLRPPGGGL